jgi:hypothetical protein
LQVRVVSEMQFDAAADCRISISQDLCWPPESHKSKSG